jgi:hypothetical protein
MRRGPIHLPRTVLTTRSFGHLLTRSIARYGWRMHPLVSIGLVFLTAFLWLAFTLSLLSRVNAAERRALRRVRKADRMKARLVRRAAVSEGTRLAHRQRLRMLKRHSTSHHHRQADTRTGLGYATECESLSPCSGIVSRCVPN